MARLPAPEFVTTASTVSVPTVLMQMLSPATPLVIETPVVPPVALKSAIIRSPETSRTLMSPVTVVAAKRVAATSSFAPFAIPVAARRSISAAVMSAVVALSTASPSMIAPPPEVASSVTRAIPAFTSSTVMSPAALTVKLPFVVTISVSVSESVSFTVNAAPLPVI